MNRKKNIRERVESVNGDLPYPWDQQLAAYREGRLISSNELDELAYALIDLKNKKLEERQINHLADILEVCLPESVRERLLRTPRLAKLILVRENGLFIFWVLPGFEWVTPTCCV